MVETGRNKKLASLNIRLPTNSHVSASFIKIKAYLLNCWLLDHLVGEASKYNGKRLDIVKQYGTKILKSPFVVLRILNNC